MKIFVLFFLISIEKTCGRGGFGGGGRGFSAGRASVGRGVSGGGRGVGGRGGGGGIGFFRAQSYGYSSSNSFNGFGYHYLYFGMLAGNRAGSSKGLFCEYKLDENGIDKKLNISQIKIKEDNEMGNTTFLNTTDSKKIGFYCEGFGAKCCKLDCCISERADVLMTMFQFILVIVVLIALCACMGYLEKENQQTLRAQNAQNNFQEYRPFREGARKREETTTI